MICFLSEGLRRSSLATFLGKPTICQKDWEIYILCKEIKREEGKDYFHIREMMISGFYKNVDKPFH